MKCIWEITGAAMTPWDDWMILNIQVAAKGAKPRKITVAITLVLYRCLGRW